MLNFAEYDLKLQPLKKALKNQRYLTHVHILYIIQRLVNGINKSFITYLYAKTDQI